ncbi:hypothetical protein GCM10017688_07690 [Streptomyces ramulosus]
MHLDLCLWDGDEASNRRLVTVVPRWSVPVAALRAQAARGFRRGHSFRRSHLVELESGVAVHGGDRLGEGELGAPGNHGGASGDLYVTVYVTD